MVCAYRRLILLMLMFAFVTLIIGGRLIWLAVAAAGMPGATVASDGPARADITDRNGVVLAANINGWAIAVQPPKVLGDRAKLASDLAHVLPTRSEAEYRAILFGRRRYVYLQRSATPELVRRVNALGEPGIAISREPERFYPQGAMASQVLGWVGSDGHGASGMETVLDRRLLDPGLRSRPVALSIDSRVQSAMESALGNAMTKHSAIGASGIVLDVDSGEVLAMVSLPGFNPNAPGKIAISTDPNLPDARFNRSISAVYELGSTFKMITVANAIENGVITDMAHRYDATAPLKVGKFNINDDHPTKRWLSVPDVLIHSSNIGTARIADELGPERSAAFFRKLSFDRPADIELGARGQPLWPGFWARTTTMTVAYGHGIAVTPLHLASAYAALVNGGILRPATLMRREPSQIPAGRRVISENTSSRMRQLMRLVVTKGTGKMADVPGLRIGGKTGTAEKSRGGGYARHSLVSTFAGVFPMDRPRYVVIAMLDEPKGTADTYGFASAAWTAGPVVRDVVARIGPLLGIIPDLAKEVDVSDLMPVIWDEEGAKRHDPE